MHRYLFFLGIVVHLVLFYSIFDIYYKSPLVKGTTPQPITNGAALAKRVFIFSAGLIVLKNSYMKKTF